jgi:hypothetical protein|tara:strand:+ start:1139 stop:1387 length:249 start_codon:yes stop_codon:yes gene_type:complete
MKTILVLMISLMVIQLKADSWFDSVGYRYYHDLDNERNGSKFRSYATKNLSNNDKLKIAYERQRPGSGMESGVFFIDYEWKF